MLTLRFYATPRPLEAWIGDLQLDSGELDSSSGGCRSLEGCGLGLTGVPGLFLLCWPRLRMLHRLRLAWGCVLGTGSWGGRGAPRGIVEGPGLETSKWHRAVPSTPGRQHMLALVTQNCPSQRSPGSSPWRWGLCQSHPLIPQPTGLCRAPRECLYPGAPTPSPRRGQGGQDETWFPG